MQVLPPSLRRTPSPKPLGPCLWTRSRWVPGRRPASEWLVGIFCRSPVCRRCGQRVLTAVSHPASLILQGNVYPSRGTSRNPFIWQPPHPSFSLLTSLGTDREVNWRSWCHFEASGVFSARHRGSNPSPSLLLSSMCLCLRVFGKEERKKNPRVNVIKLYVWVCLPAMFVPRDMPCQKKGVCVQVDATSGLCGSRKEATPLSFYPEMHTILHTHHCCCYCVFISCLQMQRNTQKQPTGGNKKNKKKMSSALIRLILSGWKASSDSNPASSASTRGFNSLNNLLMHVK